MYKMKLVELLARELKEWPEGVTHCVQDNYGSHRRSVWVLTGSSEFTTRLSDQDGWLLGRDVIVSNYFDSEFLATDHATAIVTRADWEAEKARIAGKVDGGWIRNRGSKMPVSEGTKIDVKHRDGCIYHGLTAGEGMAANWGHSKHPEDIMQYRLSSAEKRPSPKLERALKQAEEIRIAAHAPDPILIIRNRIRALDTQRAELEATYQRQIGEIEGEREGLVGKLAQEGLALVEVVQQPVEDMSDWRQWRIGDLAEVVSTSGLTQGKLSVGDVVPIIDIDEQDGTVKAAVSCWGDVGGNYKWHSRPSR